MEIEDKVRAVINEALCTEYIGRLKVDQDEDSYTLRLFINQLEAPLYFSFQGTEEQFLNHVRKDLQKRQIDRTKYYTGVQTDTGNDDITYIVLEWTKQKSN